MRTATSLVVAAALAASGVVDAADSRTDTVVVTATRTPITADDALASVTVISREDIEQRQAESLPDLLSGVTGVTVTSQGGVGKLSSLYLRGTNSDHTLILVDGVRIGSATSGRAAIEDIPVSQIQRIEVVRGPRSTLYGADAVGGVIQIFTRDAGAHVSGGFGNEGTGELSAGYGTDFGDGGFSFNASHFTTDGFDATTTDNFGHEPDRDGYRNNSVSARTHYSLTDDVEINAQFLRAEGHNEFDGTPNTGDTAQQTMSAKLGWTPSIDFDTSLRVGQSLDDSKNFQNGSDYSRFTSRRDSASWQANYAFNPANLTTVGVDYYRDRVDATVDYTETSRRNTGVFLQHQIFIGDANVQAGLRHDDNEAYGENTTGSLALGYRVMPELRAYASYGTAFKAPSFNDLYWPDEPFFHGNPDLKPEESRTGEIGLAGDGAVHWKLSAYRTVVDDLIVYDPTAAEMVNVNQAVIDGVEGEVGADLGWADATVGATWLDPRDDDSGNVLPRRARRSAFLRLNHEMGDAEVGAQARYAGDRYDDPANNTKLDAYTVVDLTTAVHINPEWIVRGRIGNVFDEDYQTAATYNTRGRNVFVSLTWQQGGTR